MRIVVKNEGDKDIRLGLPTGLLFNPVTALFVPVIAKKYDVHITVRQAMTFVSVLRDCKTRHPDWVLVEMADDEGGQVEIQL